MARRGINNKSTSSSKHDMTYRLRSFDSDRDFESLFDHSASSIIATTAQRKGAVDVPDRFSSLDGFEAPRNSFDMSVAGNYLMEPGRKYERRQNELAIPFAYEGSRSGRTEGGVWAGVGMEVPRVSVSVVARLMGLDPLSLPSAAVAAATNVPVNLSVVPPSCQDDDEPLEPLPFRRELHPQEEQLQEFKKEFAARRSSALRYLPEPMMTRNLNFPPSSSSSSSSSNSNSSGSSSSSVVVESEEEFVDTLKFLRANKDIFMKALRDPHSLLRFPPSPNPNRSLASQLPNCRSPALLPLRKTKLFVDEFKPRNKNPPLPFPLKPKPNPKQPSAIIPQNLLQIGLPPPSKIVVLKPTPGSTSIIDKLSSNNSSHIDSISHSPRSSLCVKLFGGSSATGEEETEHAKAILGDVKKKKEAALLLAGGKNPRDLAREILKQVEDDVGQKLSKLSRCREFLESKKKPPKSVHDRELEANCAASDSEGNCAVASLRKLNTNCNNSAKSLPNSPRVVYRNHQMKRPAIEASKTSKLHTPPNEHLQKGRVKTEVRRSLLTTESLTRSRSIGNAASVSDSSTRSSRSTIGSVANNLLCSNSPKSLPRSRSVPATMGAKLLNDDDHDDNVKLAGKSSLGCKNASENSNLKGKISASLKSSLSLSRKKSTPNTQKSSPTRTPKASKEVRKMADSTEQSCSQSSAPQSWSFVEYFGLSSPPSAVIAPSRVGSPGSINAPRWSSTDAVDNSSESSTGKCDEPSPVSVLRMPFMEETPSPAQEEHVHSKFSELRHNGSLLQLKNRLFQPQGGLVTKDKIEGFCSPFQLIGSKERSNGKTLADTLDSFTLDGIPYPESRKPELSYIRDIVVLCGLSKNKPTMVNCFSVEHGLDPQLFQSMEHFYGQMLAKKQKKIGRPENAWYRRLLFDMVDECFLNVAAQPLVNEGYPLTNNILPDRYVHTGQKLLSLLWSRLSAAIFATSTGSGNNGEVISEGDEDLACQEILKSGSWATTQVEVASAVLDLERLVFKDLMENLISEFGLKSRYNFRALLPR